MRKNTFLFMVCIVTFVTIIPIPVNFVDLSGYLSLQYSGFSDVYVLLNYLQSIISSISPLSSIMNYLAFGLWILYFTQNKRMNGVLIGFIISVLITYSFQSYFVSQTLSAILLNSYASTSQPTYVVSIMASVIILVVTGFFDILLSQQPYLRWKTPTMLFVTILSSFQIVELIILSFVKQNNLSLISILILINGILTLLVKTFMILSIVEYFQPKPQEIE